MRELTMHELDAQLAEQLPARELMGQCHCGSSSSSFTYNQGSYDGNFDGNGGLVGIAVGNGTLDGNNVYL